MYRIRCYAHVSINFAVRMLRCRYVHFPFGTNVRERIVDVRDLVCWEALRIEGSCEDYLFEGSQRPILNSTDPLEHK